MPGKQCNSQIKLKGMEIYYRCHNQPGHPGRHWAPTMAVQGHAGASVNVDVHWDDDGKLVVEEER